MDPDGDGDALDEADVVEEEAEVAAERDEVDIWVVDAVAVAKEDDAARKVEEAERKTD